VSRRNAEEIASTKTLVFFFAILLNLDNPYRLNCIAPVEGNSSVIWGSGFIVQSYLLLSLALSQGKPLLTFFEVDHGKYTIRGETLSISQILDKLAKNEAPGRLVFLEDIPTKSAVRLDLKEKSVTEVLDSISAVSGVRFTFLKDKYSICWSGDPVPKGQMRMYQEGGSVYFRVTKASQGVVYDGVEKVTGLSPDVVERLFDKNEVLGKKVIADVNVKVPAGEIPEETLKAIVDKVEPPEKPEPETPLTWTMTNIASNGASFDKASIDFNNGNTSFDLSEIAKSLNKVFQYGEKDDRHDPVTLVGNTFYMTGPRAPEIRRLLATQIDIPQSQIKLSFDTYVVSGNLRMQAKNNLVVQKMTMGQEIAAAYRRALLDSLNLFVAKNSATIQQVLRDRKAISGIDAERLLKECQLNTRIDRRLSIAEIYLNLAYTPNSRLTSEIPVLFDKASEAVFNAVKQNLSLKHNTDTSAGADEVWKSLNRLNRSIRKNFVKASHSNLANAIGANASNGIEDEQTRTTIEEFLALTRFKNYEEFAKALCPKMESVETWEQLFGKSVANDSSQQLARAGMRLDEILGVAAMALDYDAKVYVDFPFEGWLKQEVPVTGTSIEGVRTMGSTEMTLSSRSPGLLTTEATSFYPFQPSTDISLDGILPLIKRKDPQPRTSPSEDNKPSSNPPTALDFGLTQPEAFALKQLFAQSQLSPYHRSIGSGIKIAVLPTMLPGASGAKVLVRMELAVDPSDNNAGAGSKTTPPPVNVAKSIRIEQEILATALDTKKISSLQLDISAPSKHEWEFPLLSQNWPLKSWFVGRTLDKTIRHEAIVLMRVSIVPKAMDLAFRFL
jgi:hypothetical protein